MQMNRVFGGLAAVVVVGGAVAALTLQRGDAGAVGSVQARTTEVTAPEKLLTDVPPPPSTSAENARRAGLYVPGLADEFELERFWRECEPIQPGELEQVIEELELRVEVFTSMASQLAHGPLPQPPAMDGEMSQEEFLRYYSPIGLEEARFLLAECVEGRVRKAPFHPIPPSTLDNSHPNAQLVPHISPTLDSGYVARLESSANPRLFDDRPVAYVIAKKVFVEGGSTAAIHDHAAQHEREAVVR